MPDYLSGLLPTGNNFMPSNPAMSGTGTPNGMGPMPGAGQNGQNNLAGLMPQQGLPIPLLLALLQQRQQQGMQAPQMPFQNLNMNPVPQPAGPYQAQGPYAPAGFSTPLPLGIRG
jgi:hypothetical protein